MDVLIEGSEHVKSLSSHIMSIKWVVLKFLNQNIDDNPTYLLGDSNLILRNELVNWMI